MTTPDVDLRLDDLASIRAVDASGMLGFVGALRGQLQHGFELGGSAKSLPTGEGLRSVVVCGMGGSGVTGDVVRAVLSRTFEIPIVTAKGYGLPSFCGRNTLVLAVSYSGNTEETLSAYHEAVSRGCRVVAVASGGALHAAAREDGVPAILIPANVIAPRAALGLLVGAALGVLNGIVAAPGGADGVREAVEASCRTLDDLSARLGPAQPAERNPAKQIATWLRGAVPLVWGTEGVAEVAAVRWKTQLNEKAKVPAFWGVVPEVDHNEVEGGSGQSGESYRIVMLRSQTEPQRMAVRTQATRDAMAAAGLESREVWAEGLSALEQALTLVMLGDFVSVYLAFLRGVDPTPIPILTGLKERRAALGTTG